MNQLLEFLTGGTMSAKERTFWLPEQASTFGHEVDMLFYFIYAVNVLFVILIAGLLVFFVMKYRKGVVAGPKKTSSHNTALELTWSIPPAIVLAIVFVLGFRGFMDMYTMPQNGYEINTTGLKWSWSFTYPNGLTTGELHIPKGENVILNLTSDDVIHSVYIPAFRAKKDAVPGRFHKMWFNATKAGTYDLFCTEYCGTSHYNMKTKVTVHETRADFDKWLEAASNPYERDGNPVPLAEVGKLFYTRHGCAQCHSVDGTKNTGPTWKGIFGATHNFSNAEPTVVDENYIRESILYPNAKIVQGYNGVMPTYAGKLKDKDILAIAEYIKTLK
jgi:cytochrome c oxidase subunit 2